MAFSKDVLKIDCATEAGRIVSFIRDQVRSMHRKGIVIGLSGGVDSALSASFVEAVGRENVLALLLPEKESSPQSAEFATKQAEPARHQGAHRRHHPGPGGLRDLREAGCRRPGDLSRISATGYTLKITLPSDILNKDGYNFFTLTTYRSPRTAKSDPSQRTTRPRASSRPRARNTGPG